MGSPATLGEAHLTGERGSRHQVVCRWRADERENLRPWRFYRNVIRCGLYLTERARLTPGDRVVSLAPLSGERLILEWAVLAQGGVSVALDPAMPLSDLESALRALTPRIVLVAGPDCRAKLARVADALGLDTLILLDRKAEGATAWHTVMDLGGTLDTAERAQMFRARARGLAPSMPALGFLTPPGRSPRAAWQTMTHEEALRSMRAMQARITPAGDGVAYVRGNATTPTSRLALLSFLADGTTTTFIGSAGREPTEIDALKPHVLVAPEEVICRRGARARPSGTLGALVDRWTRRAEDFETHWKALPTTE
jgi:acyl-CoA synthetase (AMP-forming)/AMP-acid ligase II